MIPCAARGLRRECAVPWTVHPEAIVFVTVSLDDEWVLPSYLVTRRKIQSTRHFMSICGFPLHVFHCRKRKIA